MKNGKDFTVSQSISELKEALADMTRQRDALLNFSKMISRQFSGLGINHPFSSSLPRDLDELISSVDKSVTNPSK